MLKAKVDNGTLSVGGPAAHAGGLIDIEIHSNGDATVTDDGQVPIDVPISGSTAGIRAVDMSGLGMAGASLTVYGHPASVTGSAQDDHFDLGTSSDTAHAGSGDDYVFGNAGSDRLYGEIGDDVLYGGDGDDRFQGSKGNDVIDGGDGDDVALYSGNAGEYRIAVVDGLYQVTDLRTGSHDGVDRVSNVEHLQFSDRTIDLSSASTMLHAEVSAGILSVSGEAAVAGLSVGVAIAFDGGVFVTDNSDAAVAVPVSGSGSVHAVDLSDLENAGVSLTASSVGALAVTGTGHADTLYTDAASATIHGGSGDDVNYGGAGSDRLYGELGDDTLYGGGGSDRFQGSKGDDIIDGGTGVDVALYSGKASDYQVSIIDGVYQIVDLRTGVHDGTDIIGNVEHLQFSDKTIDLAGSSSLLHAALSSGTLSVSGMAAVDLNQVYVQVDMDGAPSILDNNGRVGVEVPVSGASASIHAVDLSGLRSVGVFLDGDGHALSVTGSAQADTLSLGSLDDTVHAGSGDDAVFGGYGNDRLYGELGDDQLNGGDGNDRFQGSKGNDIIDGGAGDDIALYSGKANDYHIAIANGLWQVTDLRAGSHDGIDLVGNVEHLQFSDRTIDLQGGGANPHG